MPQNISRSDLLVFGLVMGGFVLAVGLTLVFGSGDRTLGVMLLFIGALALARAESVAAAKKAIGERWPLWPGKNTLRPFTVRLWGGGVMLVGLIFVLGF